MKHRSAGWRTLRRQQQYSAINADTLTVTLINKRYTFINKPYKNDNMKKIALMALMLLTITAIAQTKNETIILSSPKFSTGDNVEWKNLSYNDSQWKSIKPGITWDDQGYANYDGFAWYRYKFVLPAAFKNRAYWKDSMQLWLGAIDDADQVFFNGTLIGKTGSMPEDAGGFVSQWESTRSYTISAESPFIHWDSENVIAIRVYDGSGPGGMYSGIPFIRMIDMLVIATDVNPVDIVSSPGKLYNKMMMQNKSSKAADGLLTVKLVDRATGKIISSSKKNIHLDAYAESPQQVSFKYNNENAELQYVFTEKNTGSVVNATEPIPYILTPKSSAFPKINGADVFGVRPGSPFLYRIPATGQKPLSYSAKNLPEGLKVDDKTGIITGVLDKEADYKIVLIAKNQKGKAQKKFTIKCGDLLALTPPMGWNSWNCWGINVTEEKAKSSAQAMIDKGLVDHGWAYINIDDGWENEARNSDGSIAVNEKFTNMKALSDWLHSNGLKLGIYSSPGPKTCGGYLGSFQHEAQDAATYAKWGIDYLKYDWCSYSAGNDTSLEAYKKPYRVMQKALRSQNRDIIYSMCQYGMRNVWKWGAEVDGNCWRTTGDITDTWKSLSLIGFNHGLEKTSAYAQPGRWNDPDMLIVGYVGWNSNSRPTHLTYDEQYLHISLWSLMAAPLLIGCDMSRLDDFTINLLTNDEVIAINQDVLGKAAERVIKKDNYEVWVKQLKDGSKAVGIFNLDDRFKNISVDAASVNVKPGSKVRDVWRQKDAGILGQSLTANVPSHGVYFVRIH